MGANLRAGLVQMTSSTDVEENVAVASDMIRAAAADGAMLVATPEMTTLLERRRKAVLDAARPEDDDRALPVFRNLAAELGIHLLIGSTPIRLGPRSLANRSFFIGPDGAIVARYDKIHRFDVTLDSGESYRESAVYEAGAEAVIARMPKAALGLSVCYDLRFPHLYRALAKAGADILMVPSAFTRTTGRAHWHVLLRARAIETGCFVLAPAQTGHHADGRETYGHSLAVAPWGEVLADGGEAVGVTVVDLDLSEVAAARGRIPALEHDRDYAMRSAHHDSAREERTT